MYVRPYGRCRGQSFRNAGPSAWGRWLLALGVPLLLGGEAESAEPKPAPAAMPQDAFAADAARKSPERSFEELLNGTIAVSDLATLIEPLFARCDDKEALPRRQCEIIRERLLARLQKNLFVALSDVAPETSPYDAAAKEIEVEISGCLACKTPMMVAGAPRYLVTRPPGASKDQMPRITLATHTLPIEEKVQADRFLERVVPRLQVQHIFKIGQPFGLESKPGKTELSGVTVIPVAHRVFDRCTGKVAVSSLPVKGNAKVAADKSCPRSAEDELSQAEIASAAQKAALPERLTPHEVELALQPVQEKIHECYVEFGEPSGTAMVQLVIGGDGKLTQVQLPVLFDKADIGICLRSQIKSARFPKFRGQPMRLEYAFKVN